MRRARKKKKKTDRQTDRQTESIHQDESLKRLAFLEQIDNREICLSRKQLLQFELFNLTRIEESSVSKACLLATDGPFSHRSDATLVQRGSASIGRLRRRLCRRVVKGWPTERLIGLNLSSSCGALMIYDPTEFDGFS